MGSSGRLDAERATLELRASSKEGPSAPTLPRLLGLACAEAGRPREARAWLELAIARDPLDVEAQRALHRLSVEATPGDVRDRPSGFSPGL
jgi:hypothetical protein